MGYRSHNQTQSPEAELQWRNKRNETYLLKRKLKQGMQASQAVKTTCCHQLGLSDQRATAGKAGTLHPN